MISAEEKKIIQKNKKTIEKAKKFFHDEKETSCMLAGRWQCEKDYEDILDYKKNIQNRADDFDVEIVKMKKRPFGYTFKVDHLTFEAKFGRKITLTLVQ